LKEIQILIAPQNRNAHCNIILSWYQLIHGYDQDTVKQ